MSESSGGPTVLVTSRSFGSGDLDTEADLVRAGFEVVRGSPDHDLAALRPALHDAVAWIAGTGAVGEAHLAVAPRLRVVARYGVGVDAVDLAAATARGIVVTNTPGANSDAVADHALALLLAALRCVVAGDRNVRSGAWAAQQGRELGSLTVGLVGFGRIGRGVARRLTGFGTRVLVHDPYVDVESVRRAGAEPADLLTMPSSCDVVSLHAPGGAQLVDESWLRRGHSGLIIVNTARADLVDESAVADALRNGRLFGYAADTLAAESTDRASPLLAGDLVDAVIVTPHIAAQTVEAVDRMSSAAVADVRAVLAGRAPVHPVAF